ncbi:MAG: DUF2541 family protein [Hyphomonadaceae bacterium]
MNLKTFVLSALAGATATAACTSAADAWTVVGAREVHNSTESDTIALEGERRFERIKLCAYRNPVHVLDLDVRFANGEHQDVAVRQRLNAGQCTHVIDLAGDDRNITTVSMIYEESSDRRTATVRLMAE